MDKKQKRFYQLKILKIILYILMKNIQIKKELKNMCGL